LQNHYNYLLKKISAKIDEHIDDNEVDDKLVSDKQKELEDALIKDEQIKDSGSYFKKLLPIFN